MKCEYLETEHLILRKAKLSDLDDIWHLVWEDDSIADKMLWVPTKNKIDAINRLEKTIKYHSNNYAFFVCLKENDRAIGFAGIREYNKDEYEDSGICISSKYQGNGYGKEVVDALKYLIFFKLNGKRFLYGCFFDNDSSRKVCLSQGFKYLESKEIVREHDNKKILVDYYYFDKEML